MPQLWLTFEEIADLFFCDPASARRRGIANQWERRRYSDGLTRALLPSEVAHEFMLRYSSKHKSVDEFDAAMAALRHVFSETERDECKGTPRVPSGVTMFNTEAIESPLPRYARSDRRDSVSGPYRSFRSACHR
jgi:hypothetical protein